VHWTTVKNYFFVPKGTSRFAFLATGNPVAEKTVVSVEGQPVEPLLKTSGLTVYEVLSGDDGKVWSVEKFRTPTPVKLLNVPNYLSFSADTLMVPVETMPEK
jgi:hypothetical protein